MSYQIKPHTANFLMGISDPAQFEDWLNKNPNIIGVSFVGRSNVGKSSIINALFGSKTARVSKTPGRTREINIFEFELGLDGKKCQLPKFVLINLPGYGHAEVSKEMSKNINGFARCILCRQKQKKVFPKLKRPLPHIYSRN